MPQTAATDSVIISPWEHIGASRSATRLFDFAAADLSTCCFFSRHSWHLAFRRDRNRTLWVPYCQHVFGVFMTELTLLFAPERTSRRIGQAGRAPRTGSNGQPRLNNTFTRCLVRCRSFRPSCSLPLVPAKVCFLDQCERSNLRGLARPQSADPGTIACRLVARMTQHLV